MDISTMSVMDIPATLTYWASLRSRVPLQSGQLVLPRYRDSMTRYWILWDFLSRYLKKSLMPSKYSLPVHSNSRSAGVSSMYGRWIGKSKRIPFLIRGLSHSRITSERQGRSEEHTSELQSRENLVCRLLLEKKKIKMRLHPADLPFQMLRVARSVRCIEAMKCM